jgi:uncharacterized protein (DUF362 family)
MTDHRMSRREALEAIALAAPATLGALSSLAGEGAPRAAQALPDLAIIHGADIKAATKAVLASLGGMSRFVSRGDVVFVKPNIGWPRTPAQGADTHPDVVAAIVEACLAAGAKIVKVGDHTLDVPDRCYRRSGIQAAAEAAGARVEILDPSKFRRMAVKGQVVGEWEVYPDIVEADTLINVPVAKHHSLSRMTGAMKNWFGAIGGQRGSLHGRIDVVVADLTAFFRASLTVLDATRVLVRNGPEGGSLADVQALGLVAASTDQVAIDAYVATLLSLSPADVPLVRTAAARGLGRLDLNRLRVTKREL